MTIKSSILIPSPPSDTSNNEQKKDWFLSYNPNGRIPVIIDNTHSIPFPVMETSAELLYLLNKFDKDHHFGFEDELEQSEVVQWLFFWHGSGAPYQGNLGYFRRAEEQSACKSRLSCVLPRLICQVGDGVADMTR
jgi:glutathione S-transferase